MALNYNKKGSVNYTIVGTPTIVDGVVSGFSSSNYLSLPAPSSTVNSFEMVFDFTKGSSWNLSHSFDCVFGNEASQNIHSPQIEIMPTGTLGVRVPSTTNSWIVISETANFIQLNSHYTIKVVWDGTNASSYYKDGNSWTLLGTQAVSAIGWDKGSYIGTDNNTNDYFIGSIDLNNTYIKIDGQAWFGVCPVEVKHIDYGTSVGYTKVGSPTISNGVVSDITDKQNTIVTSSELNVGDNSWEMQFKLLNPSFVSTYLFRINSSNNSRVTIDGTAGLKLLLNYPISSTSVSTSTLANVWANAINNSASQFYWKIQCSGKNSNNEYPIIVSCGTSLQNLTSETVTLSYAMASGQLQISSYKSYAAGTSSHYDLDLNETYIKINGKLWFYRPVTNYLVKDGKLVFADSDVYINDNGTKTYASSNIAPVPSGFTYGTTTTTDVGLVNMVTQAFTAVPGATWGKD